MSEAHGASQKPFRVVPFGRAVKEARVGELFANEVERARVLSQLRLLRHWPPPLEDKAEEVVSFAQEEVECNGVKFREIKFVKCGWLSHNQNLRVFAYVDDRNRTIWIVDGYWKTETGALPECVKRRVARRVHCLRASLQDGGRE